MRSPLHAASRLGFVVRGMRAYREIQDRERWSRDVLERFQQQRLDALVAHAVERSPFYRDRLGPAGRRRPVGLRTLPTLDKATMMEHFDELVCDRRLRRDELLEHLDGLDHDALHLGAFRVMATSGSTGRKGLFAYDQDAWRQILAQFFRANAMIGIAPRIPRLRIAAVSGASPTHMTRRVSETVDVGVHRLLRLTATAPIPELVDALNAFGPDVVSAYPSVASLLAAEQTAGRLRISPGRFATTSEACTPEVAARIRAAFGVAPMNVYGSTEGLWGCSCEQHAGIHLFEDLTLVECVDEHGDPVPDGEPGARILVTNLFNMVQPLIRFEISDMVTLDSRPCACGRTLRRATAIDGRSDDALVLAGRDGRPVTVVPAQFSLVTADRAVREFQVVQRGEWLRLRVVLAEEAAVAQTSERLRERVVARLSELGVASPRVDVETCDGLERPSGKLQIVVADRRSPTPIA